MGGVARWTTAAITMDGGGAIAMDGGGGGGGVGGDGRLRDGVAMGDGDGGGTIAMGNGGVGAMDGGTASRSRWTAAQCAAGRQRERQRDRDGMDGGSDKTLINLVSLYR